MKLKGQWASMLIATTLLAGCGTVVRSMPFPAEAQQPDASGVKVYFGSQEHPAVKTNFGKHDVSVRVARARDEKHDAHSDRVKDEKTTCELALDDALRRLRAYAKSHGANGVVNATTRFHDIRTDSTTTFTCGVSPGAGAIAVSGDVVLLDTQ
ncbi:signal peptidase [Paraburkholderia sp.]|uniref:signal peptidase n=1 Tax=Paraburkholderia sp. TaxID=1926495 RepID=UPI0025E7A817|nr:signal peptidase [Paraburkholderia sp.]